jgi:hypothetical protein
MYPKYHVILGLLFSLVVLYFFPGISLMQASIIFFSSFLIDVDHYIDYAFRKKDFGIGGLRRAYRWHINAVKKIRALPRASRNKIYTCICFLHGIEILALLALWGFLVSEIFLLIFIGFIFHLMLDLIYEPFFWDRLDKISLAYDYSKFKKLNFVDDI